MKLKYFLTALFFSKISVASSLIFDVKSSADNLGVPVTICLNGNAPLTCQNYVINGYDVYIKTNLNPSKSYTQAGIKINSMSYSISGCTNNSIGYCIFEVGGLVQTRLHLKK